MRVIDPRVEKVTREMLGQAVRGDIPELATQIQSVGGEMYRHVLGMCLVASAYVAVDACERWPTEADAREIARIVVDREKILELDEDDVYGYLYRAALAFEPLGDAFETIDKAASLPVLITASLLFRFCPRGKEWWEYLDQIWDATLTAESLDESVLPAAQIRTHRMQILKARDTAT